MGHLLNGTPTMLKRVSTPIETESSRGHENGWQSFSSKPFLATVIGFVLVLSHEIHN